MRKLTRTVTKLLFSGILLTTLFFVNSCDTWMSNDDFMSEIESEVHDANASQVKVYVRFANNKMGSTEPSGSTTMKVDVTSKVSAITSDEYGFVKWAAFSTKDFPTDKQHSNLTYISEEDYNENFKKKELSSSVVSFSSPKSPSTDVKVLSSRSDIFIIPIVTTRPTYVQSVPANGRSSVVKNSSIRIRFSKAIDKNTLYDSEGSCNISITSSPAVFTDDDNEMEAKDITDNFIFEFSPSGKMLTLTLKDDALLDNNSQITVTIYEGLCDEFGFSMSKNYSFSFTTGTKSDSLAPMIEVLVGSKDDNGTIDTFVSYYNGAPDDKHTPVLEGKATDSARAAGTDLTKYTDELYAQRVYDSLNIFVRANDIIGADENVAHDSNTLSEENVAFIGLSATLYTNNTGTARDKTLARSVIEKKNYGYVPGAKDSNVKTKKLFTDIVPLDKDGKKYSGGTIYTYDLSGLDDGLIKIDVWAIDMVGNSGEWGQSGATYYQHHDNGYKSIFVVKDTTPIDSAAVKANKKVVSNSAQAPYYWYNSKTLGTMKLFDTASNKIVDYGHAKLRSLDENLFWTFGVGDNNNAPEANSNKWVRIHDATTGESIPFDLTNAVAPSKDGPVDITLFLKDDIGNISTPVVLDSIMYDNTNPTVTLLDNYGDFVNEQGGKELHSSKNAVISQILKVAFTEPNVNGAGSGIRRMEIHVKKGNNEVTVPLDQSAFKVKWSTAADATPATAQQIGLAANDAASTDTLKVFNVNDTSKITTGTLFIYGLTLGDEDGEYTVTVDLYDSAMNKSTSTAKTIISRDTTAPIVNKVNVADAIARAVYGDDTETKTWWMPKEKFEPTADGSSTVLTKVSLVVTANESGSGLELIKVANDVEFTTATKLKKGSEYLTAGTDYTLDTVNHTIKLLDNYTAKLKGTGNASFDFTLENVKLKNLNSAAGNKINVKVTDFVNNSGSNLKQGTTDDYQIYYSGTTTTGTLIYADNTPPAVAALHIEDTAQNTTKNPDNKAWDKDNYTDNQNVVLTLTLTAESLSNGSGVKTIRLSNNALFTNTTKIFVDNNELTSGFTFAGDKKSVTFNKVFTAANVIKFTDVHIESAVEGSQLVSTALTDFVGLDSAVKASNSLTYDITDPVVSKVEWIADDALTTAGIAKNNSVTDQTLKVDFTEITAGTKVIKFDITGKEDTVSYTKPFDLSGLTITYNNNPVTDYAINSDGRYIILNNTYKSGTFRFHGIKLTDKTGDAAEDLYTIKVSLLDAAENKGSREGTITIDATKPVIDGYLEIPEINSTTPAFKYVKELTTASGTPTYEGNWLAKEYVNGSGSSKAADKIPVLITVKEAGSGIKVINFHNNAVLSTATKLYRYKDNGVQEEIPSSKYTVDTTANKITIISEKDASELFSKRVSATDKTPVPFKILVDNVGVNKADTLATDTTDTVHVSDNIIKVSVSDVAKNLTEPMVTSIPHFYTDSINPAPPTNLNLVDRDTNANAPKSGTIKACSGYTNESIVDMTFSLSDSEKYGSGYHMFEITGARFKKAGTADSDNTTTITSDVTSITMESGNAEIQNLFYDVSDDGRFLILKKSGDNSSETNYVVRQAVNVVIKNVHLDNGTTQGSKTVTLKAYDLTGWSSTAPSKSITFDTGLPTIDGNGPYVANYTVGTSPSYYYNPAINVYPHVSSDREDSYGVSVDYSGTSIPTFYTATSYSTSGVSQVNGQISITGSAQYGVVLGFRVRDSYKVRGSDGNNFMYYISDSDFSKTKAQIVSSGTPLYNSHTNKVSPATPGNYASNSTNYYLWFTFPVGKYSAVVVDAAGNVSDVFRFAVVKDTEKPLNTGANNLNDRVLLQMPDNSAKAYMKNAITKALSSQFPVIYHAHNMGNYSIRTKKYVTKKTTNKYKIQLNLNGAYSSDTPITKIDGTTASDTTKYSDLDATATSSPIEKYAISTSYGAWPTSESSTYKYSPVVPYGTKFPSGQTHTGSGYQTDTLEYQLGHNYFNYESGPESNAWRISSTNVTWHPYKYSSSSNYDSGNYIYSRVDDKNNLIIEIPNTQSTAPISVFLQDGCGNIQYVVCGVYTDNVSTSPSYGQEVAISFVIDNKLGHATTTNGQVSTPIIMQNPYMTYASSSPNVAWPSSSGTSGFYWNHNTGNGNQGGEGGRRGFIKDYVKYATYYNPNIDYTNTAQQFKIGLTLNYDTRDYKRDYPEDILFDKNDESLGKVTAPDPLSNDSNKSDYTCRALLYCKQTSDKPTYDEIMSANVNVKNSYGGFRTEWVGVRATNDTSLRDDSTEDDVRYKVTGTTILLDYPKPNYTTLGWNTNDTNGEPKPYYIWYIFEDYVGNYEIAKIVNSNASGTSLTTTTSEMFDRWLYDNDAPKIVIRGTSNIPTNLSTSDSNVKSLIPENDSTIPYRIPGTNTVYVYDGGDRSYRSTYNQNIGNGTTRYCSDYSTSSKYWPFFDLAVSEESTGVRAFAWSTSSSVPDYSSSPTIAAYDSYWRTGSTTYWMSGTNSLTRDIGESSYTSYGSVNNGYFYSSSNYSGKYSGTKVNTIIPYGKLSNTTETPLYLHVMDWTGNVTTYKMGANLSFIKDAGSPEIKYTTDSVKGDTRSSDNEYFVRSDGNNIEVRIAGKGAGSSTNRQNIQVRLPDSYIEDSGTYGSGYKGFAFQRYSISSVLRDTTGPYILLDYNTYKDFGSDTDTATEKSLYFYDNVGNVTNAYTAKFVYDTDAPVINSVSVVTEANSDTELANKTGLITNTVSSYGRVYDCPAVTTTWHDDTNSITDSELQVVYLNKTGTTKFHVNLAANSIGDLAEVKVNRWNGTKWIKQSSSKTETWSTSTTSTTKSYCMGSNASDGYDVIFTSADTSAGAYYQIVASDFSGNASSQYFRLILDNAAPTFASTTPKPVVTLGKGSIGKAGNIYYYAADTSYPLKLNFGIEDAGSGSETNLKKFKYSLDGSTWVPANGYISDPSDIEIDISSGNIETFYFMDILGNKQEIALKPELSYTYKNASGDSKTVSIPKLTQYTNTPAAPAIHESIMQDSNNDNSPAYKIVTEVETYGKGMSDAFVNDTECWSHLHTEKLENVANTIFIKEMEGKERSKVRITFPEPKSTDAPMIIGYLKSDVTPLTISSSDTNQIGKYSLADTFANSFEDELDINHAENTIYEKHYYAVDIVGNISPALTLYYGYENPHIPKKCAIIDPLNSSTDKTNKNYIDATVKAQMESDGIDFAKIISVDPIKSGTDKNEVKIFGKGFMVVRCTLYKQAGDSYSETPKKIELWDKWSENPVNGRGLRAETGPTNDPTVFKVYSSTVQDSDDRYFCWIAFKPGQFGTGENAGTFTTYVFDNNAEFNGSNLHGFIKGATCQSGFIPLDPDTIINANGSYQHKVGWMLDKDAPKIDGKGTVNNNENYIQNGVLTNYSYTVDGTIKTSIDNAVGNKYVSVTYQSGTKIQIPEGRLKDSLSGVYQYKIDIVDGDTIVTEGTWTDKPETGDYAFELPDVTSVHKGLKLSIKDRVNNIRTYTLANPENSAHIWWIVNNILPEDGTGVTWTAPTWTEDAENYTFNVTPPEGSIIKKVTVKVDGHSKDGDVNWGTVKFNGYKTEYGQTPNFDGTTGWLVVNNEEAQGLSIVVKKITKDWANHKVEISINDNANLTKTYNNFVTAKELTGDNIQLDTDNAVLTTIEGGVRVCSIPYSLTDGAPDSLLTTIATTPENVVTNAKFDKTNHKIILTGVAAPSWDGAVPIDLTINGNITKTAVYTIPKRNLEASDITLDLEGKTLSNTTLTIPVSLSGAPRTEVTSVSASVGETALNAALNEAGDTITIQGIPAPIFTGTQDIKLTINTFDMGTVYTVDTRVLIADDIILKYNNATPAYVPGTNSYYLTIELPSSLTVSSVTKPEGSPITVSWDANNATGVTVGNVEQSWTTETPIKLVINNVTKLVFNVPQRTFAEGDLTSVTSNPAAWAADSAYTVTVTATAGAPITSIKLKIDTTENDIDFANVSGLGDGNVVQNTGSFTVSLAKIDQTNAQQSISLVVNGIEKSLFTIDPSANINTRSGFFAGRKAKSVDINTGNSSAEPVKTRSVSLFNWVAEMFNGNEETADKVAADSTVVTAKEAKKQAKKAKKAAKKAAKAAELVADEALPAGDVVSEAAAVLEEVTERAAAEVSETGAESRVEGSVEREALAPLSTSAVTPAAPEATGHDNRAILWTIIAAASAALITLIAVIYTKRRKA